MQVSLILPRSPFEYFMSKKQIQEQAATLKRWNKRIGPITKEVSERFGMGVEITRQFSRLQGREIARQTIDGWLRRDPARRVEPSAGTAELLFEAIAAARRAVDKKAARKAKA